MTRAMATLPTTSVEAPVFHDPYDMPMTIYYIACMKGALGLLGVGAPQGSSLRSQERAEARLSGAPPGELLELHTECRDHTCQH